MEPDKTDPASRQEQSRLALIRKIEDYLAASSEYEAEEGPYSNELKENLFTLGKLYQEQGDHEEAIGHLQRTLNIVRVNNGLNSFEQLPVLEALALSYDTLERYSDADAMKDLVLEIHKRVYDDMNPELVPAMAELGDWNVQAFLDRSNMITNITRMDATEFIEDPINYIYPDEVSEARNSPLFKLYEAQGNYLNAINILVQNKNYTHPLLLGLERKLLNTYFLRTHQENILYEPDFYLTRKKSKTGSRLNQNSIELMNSEDYEQGQASLQRTLAYIASDPKHYSPQALARAMLETADWDLLYVRKAQAFKKYKEAYAFFAQHPEMEPYITDIIYPETPQVLPVFLPPPNSREKLGIPEDETVEYLGYFDVSFGINKYGKAKRVRVRDRGGEVNGNMEIRLKRYLRNVQFRPRFDDGKVDTGTASYRYNVGF